MKSAGLNDITKMQPGCQILPNTVLGVFGATNFIRKTFTVKSQTVLVSIRS